MANTKKILRSAITVTPASLEEGQLAYSELSGNLFIGTSGANLAKIGGNTDVTKLLGIEAGAQVNTVDSVNGQTGVVSLASGNLSDITLTAIATNDVLRWNVGGFWENVPQTSVGVTDHTALSNIGTNTHAQIDTHLADATVHFTEASISITESQISDLGAYLTDITGESIKDLSDVFSTMVPTDGQVLTFDTVNGWQSETPSTGVTDHTALTSIGTNTHAEIDTHIADGTVHFTQAAISITKSQVSDFVEGDYVHTTGIESIAGAKTFSDNMIINADLTVNGTTTTINTDNLVVTDNTITVNNGETGAGVTLGSAGIIVDRGTAADTSWIWDEATDQWGYTSPAGSPVGVFVPVADAVHFHDAADVTTGTFADARISETSVTQHVGAIDHDSLLNYVANEHIDHTGVTLTAGEGISGGGDISASRTFNLDVNGLVVMSIADADGSADYVLVYDASAGTHKKMLINDFLDDGQF